MTQVKLRFLFLPSMRYVILLQAYYKVILPRKLCHQDNTNNLCYEDNAKQQRPVQIIQNMSTRKLQYVLRFVKLEQKLKPE